MRKLILSSLTAALILLIVTACQQGSTSPISTTPASTATGASYMVPDLVTHVNLATLNQGISIVTDFNPTVLVVDSSSSSADSSSTDKDSSSTKHDTAFAHHFDFRHHGFGPGHGPVHGPNLDSLRQHYLDSLRHVVPPPDTVHKDIHWHLNLDSLRHVLDSLRQNGGPGGHGGPGSGIGGHDGGPNNNPFFLGYIFQQMKLTPDEMTAIQGFEKDYMSCVQAAMAPIIQQQQAIEKQANAQRQQILSDLKAGTIDLQTAMTQLKALNDTTMKALQALNDPTATCDCLKTFFASIRSTLTPAQQAQWDAWVATLKGPCFP